MVEIVSNQKLSFKNIYVKGQKYLGGGGGIQIDTIP